MATNLLVPKHIGISPNEYVTKYVLNRSFEQLISNDIALVNAMDDASSTALEIETYNKSKTYDEGTFVFYKVHPNDT